MRIGLINALNGRPDGPEPSPTWASIHQRAITAEQVGFDMFVFEDGLMYRGEEHSNGVWESGTIAGALAASTDRMRFGQSVINTPYRNPALVAAMATTLDDVSDGRYVLGIGAGNTDDYEAFGLPSDRRYSRFAEAIQIIHSLLRNGATSFSGEFYHMEQAEIVLRGPTSDGPTINIAAGGPKMMTLVARYADEWNWWSGGESHAELEHRLSPIIDTLEQEMARNDRDPSSLERTLDLYGVIAPGFEADAPPNQPASGTPEQIAHFLLGLRALGFEEVRCDVYPNSPEAILAMGPVVDLVHRG